jgi:hypothetical protein
MNFILGRSKTDISECYLRLSGCSMKGLGFLFAIASEELDDI